MADVYVTHLSNPGNTQYAAISAVGKALLAFSLADLYGMEDGCPPVKTAKNGKPYFPDHREIRFNISHSGRAVVCAVSASEVGIDVQEMRITDGRKLERLGRKVFSEETFTRFLALPDEAQRTAFFREWSMKEAYVKWTGEGLTRDPRALPMDGWHRFLEIEDGYVCVVWAGQALEVRIHPVSEKMLSPYIS